MSKQDIGNLFKKSCTKLNQGPNIDKIHVFNEPHKRYNKKTNARERHIHVVFKMKAPFAHLQIQKALASHGVRGNFSFNLPGYIANLSYCLLPSAKKLGADLDLEPWSWPAVPVQTLKDLCEASAEKAQSAGQPGQRGSDFNVDQRGAGRQARRF